MKNKKIIIPIVILIVIVIIIATVILLLNKQKVKPEDILKQYMSYIVSKDYEQMYNLTTKDTLKEEYITRNKNIYEGIEVSKVDINVAKTNKKGKETEVVYTTVINTVAGEINFSNTANLIKENDTYKIKWSSNIIFPSLRDDYKVRVSRLEAKRGEILDRNGKILAGEKTASQIGLVPGKMNEMSKEQDIQTISTLLDISVESINNSLSASYVKENTFVPLKTVLKSEVELKNSLLQISGIKIVDTEERIYNLGEATTGLLGYKQGISHE